MKNNPGIEIKDFLSDESLKYVTQLSYDLPATRIEDNEVPIEVQKLLNVTTCKRENIELYWKDHPDLAKEVEHTLRYYYPAFKRLGAGTIWRDYTGYSNSLHYDDPDNVRNIAIVYLTEDPLCGTVYYVQDGIKLYPYYCEPKVNRALCLVGSHQTFHGMKYYVPKGVIRRSFYINFILETDDKE